MERKDSSEWIMRTVRKILKESGPKAARRFIDSRGGSVRWEAASREIGRAVRASAQTKEKQSSISVSPLYQVHHRGW
jgi:hypothetical protein